MGAGKDTAIEQRPTEFLGTYWGGIRMKRQVLMGGKASEDVAWGNGACGIRVEGEEEVRHGDGKAKRGILRSEGTSVLTLARTAEGKRDGLVSRVETDT